jgi:hypothetical protein
MVATTCPSTARLSKLLWRAVRPLSITMALAGALVAAAPAAAQDACCLPFACQQPVPPATCQLMGGLPGPSCAGCIPQGYDCFATDCGRTGASFCNNPIPADFFFPGSQPFSGRVQLHGASGSNDTQVRRLAPAMLSNPGEEMMIPIELVQLSLVSCQPITVSGPGPNLWDVSVGVSSLVAPATTQMTIRKTHPNGGTFSSTLAVKPVFTFSEVGNPGNVRVLDTGLLPDPPETLQTISGPNNWVHVIAPSLVTGTICGVNFVPGVQGDPAQTQLPPACIPPEGMCCQQVGHAGPGGSLHVTGTQCTPCKCGACCSGGSCDIATGIDPATTCAGLGGDYKGDGSHCGDTDGDGIPDALESHHCCGPTSACGTGSNPADADTDNDGVEDGHDLNACVAQATVVPAIDGLGLAYAVGVMLAMGLLGLRWRGTRV